MKKFLVVLGVCLFAFAFVAGDLLAYQEAFNISGHRTQSRNAAAGTIDAAYYNPVGLVKMQDGLYVDLGNRILGLTTETKVENSAVGMNNESESSTITWLLPNAAVSFKSGKGAIFYAFDIREGGAGGYWDDDASFDVLAPPLYVAFTGDLTFANLAPFRANLKTIDMTTFTFGHTFGGAFELNDMVSIAGGLRYFKKISDVTIEQNVGDDTEVHYSWEGYAGFMGALITPMQGLNVSLQFQGRSVKLATTEAAYNDGASVSPSIFLLGVAYKVMPELEVMFSYNREFTASWDKNWDKSYPFDEKNKDKQVFGLGAEYTVMPALLVSAGVSYKITDTADENNYDVTDPAFNEIDLGFGAVYKVMPELSIEAGVAYNYYLESESKGAQLGDYTHNRSAWIVGIGASYKAL